MKLVKANLIIKTTKKNMHRGYPGGTGKAEWQLCQIGRLSMAILEWINNQTRWIYSLSVLAYFISDPSINTCYALTGAILAAIIGKVMKKLINQSRPENAREKDPGMPSSHANCIAYLSIYPSLQMVLQQTNDAPQSYRNWSIYTHPPHRLIAAVSWAQPTDLMSKTQWHLLVVAGFALGSVLAVTWLVFGEELLLPAARMSPTVDFLVRTLSLVCLVIFAEWDVNINYRYCCSMVGPQAEADIKPQLKCQNSHANRPPVSGTTGLSITHCDQDRKQPLPKASRTDWSHKFATGSQNQPTRSQPTACLQDRPDVTSSGTRGSTGAGSCGKA
eukprot:g56587.t1